MKKKEPLVSIVAVNYNFEKYLLETLKSIKQLTYKNTELIIIDDHSTDQSIALIEQWMKKYKKPVKLIVNETNLGICATLNKAFRITTGKYICAIAMDDTMMPERLTFQVPIMESAGDNVCAVYSDAFLINEEGGRWPLKFLQRLHVLDQPKGNIYERLLNTNFIPAMTVLLRKDRWLETGGFDEQIIYEDYDMWLRLARQYEFTFSDYISAAYRVKRISLSTQIEWDIPNISILMKHLSDHPLAIIKLREIALRGYNKKSEKVMDALEAANIADEVIESLIQLFKKKAVPA